jgi:hypothetical protein
MSENTRKFPSKVEPKWRVECGLCGWSALADSQAQAEAVLEMHAVTDHAGWQQAGKAAAPKAESRDDDLKVLFAMRVNGGGFLSALAEAGFRADSDNLRRIKLAWPEYWAQYERLAKLAEADKADQKKGLTGGAR